MHNLSSLLTGLCLLSFTFSPLMAQVMSSTFEAQSLGKVDIGYGLAIGDVDGDGKKDILLADKTQFVWYRNGDWQRFVMVENLTEKDNVCLAARDINGDGQVEVAVGAQWNPGETSDTALSGSVHYLLRPEDPTQRWQPVQLHHEPTVHRMRWVKTSSRQYQLIVLPLHGRGNKAGEGEGVKILGYSMPSDPTTPWDTTLLDQQMHMTHNLAVNEPAKEASSLLIAGKEGVSRFTFDGSTWQQQPLAKLRQPAGEVRMGSLGTERPFITTIEPIHGNRLMLYSGKDFSRKTVLSDQLEQGHALACADVLGLGRDQIIVGWREPNREGKVGIKIFVPMDESGEVWTHHYIDDNGMACEDLQVADLDEDGDLDIIAAGRATQNLKIYWNNKMSD
ncbi:MAG: FG-GAP repeat domain-containing protein [Cyclobacteriaceae bacterium]